MPGPSQQPAGWLTTHWVAGALFMGTALVLLVPVLAGVFSLPVMLVYLHGPAYMLHQVEEHWDDRFRRFINTRLFGGVEALTVDAVLWTNLPGVWGVNIAALYAAVFGTPGLGLAAPYLVLVNGIIHIVGAVRLRCYNPGVTTGIAIFMPLGAVTLWLVSATLARHLLSLAFAVALHAVIAGHTARHAAVLKAAG